MKTTIQRITIDIIYIILSIIAIATQVEIIKDALDVDSIPPLYTLRIYTVLGAGAITSFLIYFIVSKAVDLYTQYISFQLSSIKENQKVSPLTHTIEECRTYRESRDNSPKEEIIRHTLEEPSINPIDLKFDKMIEGAKEASINLRKKRNVQE